LKASIIIPVYNQAEYLGTAIESAVKQTHRDTEVIIVNDGSTDNALDVAKIWAIGRSNVKIINKVNGGLPNARNSGALASTGDVLLPLDADDYIDPTFLEKTIPLMRGNVAIVAAKLAYFGLRGGTWDPPKPTLDRIIRENCIPVCSLIKRFAFIDCGGYPGRMVNGFEDWALWIDILSRGYEAEVIDEPLFHYRVKERSMFTDICANHAALVDQLKSLYHQAFAKQGRQVEISAMADA